jgi:hypothetical protein
VTTDENEARGCTFLTSADTSVPCPASADSKVKCLAWRAVRASGNLITDSEPPRVYRCGPGA